MALGAVVPEILPAPLTLATVIAPVKEFATGPEVEPDLASAVKLERLEPTVPVVGTLTKAKWVGGRVQVLYHLILSKAIVAALLAELSP